MKKIIIILSFLMITKEQKAQFTFPNPGLNRAELTGTNPGIWFNVSGTRMSHIGSDGSANHAFGIFNQNLFSWHFNMLNNGNVGIGLANPMAQLHTTGTVRFAGLGTSNNTDFIVADASGNLSKRSMTSFGGNTTNACNTLNMVPRLTNIANNTYSCGVIMDNGTNVGIGGGAAIPQARLDVSGGGLFRNGNNFAPTVHQLLFAWDYSSGNGNLFQHGIRTRHDGTVAGANNNSIDFHLWRFVDGASGLPSLRAMTLNNQGRLGINLATGSPLNNLHVEGDARITNLPTRALNDRLVFANSAGELKSLNPGTQNEYLRGDGSWGSVSGANIYNSDGILTDNRLVSMADKNLHFIMDPHNGSYDRQINIQTSNVAYNPNVSGDVLFNVIKDETNPNKAAEAAHFSATTSGDAIAVGLRGSASNGLNCTGSSTVGGLFNSRSSNSIGLAGIAWGTTAIEACSNPTYNVGGYFEVLAPDLSPGYSTAIEAHANGIVNNNLGTTGNSYAGLFYGDCYYSANTFISSDKKIKKNITDITDAIELLNKVSPKKYDFDNEKYPSLNLPSQEENFGLIAQELEVILPSLVKEIPLPGIKKEYSKNKIIESTGEMIKSVNYTELIPIAISAIKELNAKVEKQNNAVAENEALKTELASVKEKLASYDEKFALLEKTITQLCESGCEGLKKTGEGSSSEVDVLYQSIPNPTDSEALINYFLIREYRDASITVSTQEGKLLKSVKLDSKKGSGSIKLSLGELASGTYLYTLVAGERVVDTKRLQIVK